MTLGVSKCTGIVFSLMIGYPSPSIESECLNLNIDNKAVDGLKFVVYTGLAFSQDHARYEHIINERKTIARLLFHILFFKVFAESITFTLRRSIFLHGIC